MRWVLKQNSFSPPPTTNTSSVFFARNVVIIVVIMFLVCGMLHFLMKKIKLCLNNGHHQSTRFQESSSDGDAAAVVYQRQLQQLFSLHDSGLDQSSIDALPVFIYKELVGLKEPLHCAVCLCEYKEEDHLRLLPVCSHAFHLHCIDTWLLTSSTCPLCRGSLFTPGFAVVNPVFDFDFDFDLDHDHSRDEEQEVEEEDDDDNDDDGVCAGNFKQSGTGRVYQYPVRLGNFRAINGDEKSQEVGQTSNSNGNGNGNLDERRCYSMGSYEYVVGNSNLQVAFCCPNKGSSGIGNNNNGGDLRMEKDPHPHNKKVVVKEKGKGNSATASSIDEEGRHGKFIISNGGSKGDSFSVSKIWLWSKKHDHTPSSFPIWSNPLSM